MDIKVHEIDGSQAKKIISIEESHFVDVKSKEISPAKLSRSLSAFANTSGGELYIGISEKSRGSSIIREWIGFDSQEEANGHIQGLDSFFPLGDYCQYSFLKCSEQKGYVLKIEIQKTRDIKAASDSIPYVRRGAQSIPAKNEEMLSRLKLDKGIFSFEDDTVPIPIEVVSNSKKIIEFIIDVIPSSEPEDWLKSQFLIDNNKPTVAGVLLFSDEPQAALPKRSSIKIYRYKTSDAEGKRDSLAFDPITIEGPLYELIYTAVEKTSEIVSGISKLTPTGMEKVQYPPETLHEIVTNAVLHRDYSIPKDIQVRIYDNRVEVESPGRLPGHVNVENILGEQFARNSKTVRIINKFPNPPNKDVGEGLDTAFAAMKNLRLKEPEIVETEHSVIVYIRHEPLASPEDTVLKFLDSHQTITNRIARAITGVSSENTMKEVFYRLRDRNLLQRVMGESGPKNAWEKTEK